MSTPIEAVIDEIVAVSASVAPWAPPLTRDQAADLLASYARHALGLSKDLPAGASELFPRAYRPKRVVALGLGPVYATPAPVKVALAPVIASPAPPPLPVKAREAVAAPLAPAAEPDLDPVEVIEVPVDDVQPLDRLPMWASVPGAAPVTHTPVISMDVFAAIVTHYGREASISVHALRERRPPNRGALENPLSGLANGFVAVVIERGTVKPLRIEQYTTRTGLFQSAGGDLLEVHFILDFDAMQIVTSSNRSYDVEREALVDYEDAEQERLVAARAERVRLDSERLLALLDSPRRAQ